MKGKPSRLQEKRGGSLPVISLEGDAVKAPGEEGKSLPVIVIFIVYCLELREKMSRLQEKERGSLPVITLKGSRQCFRRRREKVSLSSALRGKPSRLQENESGSLPVISLEREAVKAPREGERKFTCHHT